MCSMIADFLIVCLFVAAPAAVLLYSESHPRIERGDLRKPASGAIYRELPAGTADEMLTNPQNRIIEMDMFPQ